MTDFSSASGFVGSGFLGSGVFFSPVTGEKSDLGVVGGFGEPPEVLGKSGSFGISGLDSLLGFGKPGLGIGGVDGFEDTGSGPVAVPGLGIGGTGGVGGFGVAGNTGVTGNSSSGSNPFGKPGSGNLIFSGNGNGPPFGGAGVSGSDGSFTASGEGDAGAGNVPTVLG